ncbi:MAG: hypothetical protein V4628_03870 [Pseudomonadota bacterium]
MQTTLLNRRDQRGAAARSDGMQGTKTGNTMNIKRILFADSIR